MDYVKVTWTHEYPDEPVVFLSELDEDRYETRKVQIYADGRLERADQTEETASVGISDIAFPPLDQISAEPDIDAEEMTAAQFEEWWMQAQNTAALPEMTVSYPDPDDG